VRWGVAPRSPSHFLSKEFDVSRIVRLALAAGTLALVLGIAAPALAAPQSWDSIDVIAKAEGSGSLLLVSGELPQDAKLPAEVSLAVPAGAQLIWSGEILGGPAESDPAVEPTKVTKAGADIYSFTLTQARRGQVEVAVPAVAAYDGSAYAAALKWTGHEPVPTVRLSVQVPQGAPLLRAAENSKLEPAADGSSYYTRTFEGVEAGTPLALEFAYGAPAAAPAASNGGQATNTAIPIVLGLAGFAALAALLFAVSRKLSAKSAARGAEDDEEATSEELVSEAGEVAAEDSSTSRPRKLNPVTVMLIAVGVVAIAAVFTISMASGPQVADGKLSKSFGGEASACTSTTIAIKPAQGVDLAKDGEEILDAFAGMQGVGAVTLYTDDSRVEVQFCESTTTEDALKGALTNTGLVTF